MGVVFLAVRAGEQFRQQVALEILRRDFNAPEVLSRFQHERQVPARLSHPNIATFLDGGTTPEGDPYVVMEHIEGLCEGGGNGRDGCGALSTAATGPPESGSQQTMEDSLREYR